jgi:hypothetical protein
MRMAIVNSGEAIQVAQAIVAFFKNLNQFVGEK